MKASVYRILSILLLVVLTNHAGPRPTFGGNNRGLRSLKLDDQISQIMLFARADNIIQLRGMLSRANLATCRENPTVHSALQALLFEQLSGDVIYELLDHGAPMDGINNDGETLLHRVQNSKIAEFLILRGADIEARDCNDRTPLHSAIAREDIDVVQALLNYHAQITPECLSCAQEHGIDLSELEPIAPVYAQQNATQPYISSLEAVVDSEEFFNGEPQKRVRADHSNGRLNTVSSLPYEGAVPTKLFVSQ